MRNRNPCQQIIVSKQPKFGESRASSDLALRFGMENIIVKNKLRNQRGNSADSKKRIETRSL